MQLAAKKHFHTAALCMAALLTTAQWAQAQEARQRVAVFEPEEQVPAGAKPQLTPMQRSIIQGALEDALTSTGSYTFLDRSRVGAAMKELNAQRDFDIYDQEGRKEFRSRLAADLICLTSVTLEKANDRIRINLSASIMDVETGEITHSASDFRDVKSNGEISAMVGGLVAKLIPRAVFAEDAQGEGVVQEEQAVTPHRAVTGAATSFGVGYSSGYLFGGDRNSERYHVNAIASDGSLWVWSAFRTREEQKRRVGWDEDSAWVAVSRNYALKADGSLWYPMVSRPTEYRPSVDNKAGKRAINMVNNRVGDLRYEAFRVGKASDWAAVSEGYHTMALKRDGSLWAWGTNRDGQLGDGTQKNREGKAPVRVGKDRDWVAVSAGSSHTAALKKDGSLWTWGSNEYGQLGDGTTSDRSKPVRVGKDRDWAAVSAGGDYTVALKNDGSLWAWGYNNYEQLGVGNANNESRSPVRVGAGLVEAAKDAIRKTAPVRVGAGWVAVSAGRNHIVALKADGSLWAWGDNRDSQLGGAVGTERSRSPVRVGADSDWAAVAATVNSNYTLAVKTDGSLWVWGSSGVYNRASITIPAPVLVGTGIRVPTD